MNIRVTVVSYVQGEILDKLGLEAYSNNAPWVASAFAPGLTTTFDVSGAVWSRLRSELMKLSQMRIPAYNTSTGAALGTGATMPAITYSAEWLPGGRPRIHQIEGAPLSLADPANLTIRGTGFLGAQYAKVSISKSTSGFGEMVYPPTRMVPRLVEVFRVTSVLPGPAGNNISISIAAASGAGSVTTTYVASRNEINIRVVPAAGSSTTTAIAAQINGDSVASTFVTATAVVASIALTPTELNVNSGPTGSEPNVAQSVLKDRMFLTGGDGSSPATADLLVSGTSMANRLKIVSTKAGNDRNLITITINASQGANSVSVSGNDITVDRTTATTAIATLASAINANTAAAALVTASAVGSGSIGAVSKTWLRGGAGESVSITIGGAATTVVSQTDTAIEVSTTNAALLAAGVAAGDVVSLQMVMHYGLVHASVGTVAA